MRIHVRMHLRMHVRTHVRMHVKTHVRTHVRMHSWGKNHKTGGHRMRCLYRARRSAGSHGAEWRLHAVQKLG